MRVGIHSGRVLCGVLGEKKWQFDVHSDDVKLANHMEQSGTPGRVHITEETLKALRGRYPVEPAYGSQRDTYIAQRNIATYFVIPPAHRRGSLANKPASEGEPPACGRLVVEVGAANNEASTANALQDTPSVMVTQTSGQQLDVDLSRRRHHLPDQISQPFDSMGGQTVVNLGSQRDQQQQPNQLLQQPMPPSLASGGRLRFRQASQRIINALHFLKTIDVPFSDLPTASETNPERNMHDKIVSRCQIQDIEPISLKFKDPQLADLYVTPSRFEILKRLLIFLSSILCLLLLAFQTLPGQQEHSKKDLLLLYPLTNDHNHQLLGLNGSSRRQQSGASTVTSTYSGLSDHTSGGNILNDTSSFLPVDMKNEFANTGSSYTDRQAQSVGEGGGASYYSPAHFLNQTENHHHHHHHSLALSFSLIGIILSFFFITQLVYMHQAEYSARRDFLWRQIAIQDKDKMALIRDCNRFIFSNLLPPHVAPYFLPGQRLRHHTVSDYVFFFVCNLSFGKQLGLKLKAEPA